MAKITTRKLPVTDEQIEDFESNFKLELPSSYVEFLKVANGGAVTDGAVLKDGISFELQYFFHLFGQTVGSVEIALSNAPPMMLPVADCLDGKLVFVNLVTRGVHYGETGPLFESFGSFLSSLDLHILHQTGDDLVRIARAGDIKSLEVYIESGGDPNARAEDGRTMAEAAIIVSEYEFLKRLKEVGGDVSPAFFAVAKRGGNFEQLSVLKELGGNINHRDEQGKTPIELVREDRIALKEYFKRLGAIES